MLQEPRSLPHAAHRRAALLLAAAGNLLIEQADETLADAGLAARDYSILSIIDTDGPGSQQELARLLRKAPAIVVVAVDALEARGLVTRVRDPADRRRTRVTITDAGRAALARADELADQAFAALFPGLDSDELAQFKDLLARGVRPMLPEPTTLPD